MAATESVAIVSETASGLRRRQRQRVQFPAHPALQRGVDHLVLADRFFPLKAAETTVAE